MRIPGLISIIAIGVAACDSPAPATPPASAPVVEQIAPVPGPHADGYIVQLQSGKWCTVETDESFVSGNDRVCAVFMNATIRVDDEMGAPYRRVTMKSNYHQPGPETDDGHTVSWNEADIRYNCETDEMWMMSIVTYGLDGAVILNEPYAPPRPAPGTNPDMGKMVCAPEL